MTLKQFGTLSVLALLISTGVVSAQESYSQWEYNRTITLNTSATGANVAAAVTNFPVLVRLTAKDSAIFAAASANGSDIRFSKADGTHLKYQIERWDATNKIAELWVKMDTLFGNTSAATLKMYMGKSGAADSSSPGMVFDTANGYQAVFHFAEGTNNPITADATVNGYKATASAASIPADTAGIIGRGRYFDGTNGFSILGSKDSAAFIKIYPAEGSSYTLSAWSNLANFNSTYGLGAIIAKGGANATYHLYTRFASTNYRFLEQSATVGGMLQTATGTATTNTWVYLVGVKNADTMLLYLNGTLVTSATAAVYGSRFTEYDVNFGRRSDSTSSASGFFNGILDEIQIANVPRDSNWVKLSYENQKENQTLVNVASSFNAIRTVPEIAGSTHATTIDFKVNGQKALHFAFTSATTGAIKAVIVDLHGHTVWSKTVGTQTHDIAWNGETHNGHRAVAGTYVVRIISSTCSSQQKITYLP